MSEAQHRAFGGNGFFFLFPPDTKGEAAGYSPKPKGHEAIPARLDPFVI
jgi:hypothetical protein